MAFEVGAAPIVAAAVIFVGTAVTAVLTFVANQRSSGDSYRIGLIDTNQTVLTTLVTALREENHELREIVSDQREIINTQSDKIDRLRAEVAELRQELAGALGIHEDQERAIAALKKLGGMT